MIQQIGRHTVRVRGRFVNDGGMLWLASSLSEAGFRVTGAKHVEVVLRADDTPLREECGHQLPRYDVMVDGDEVSNGWMDETEKTVLVFDSSRPWGAEVRIRKLSECTQSLLAIREIRTDGRIEPLEEQGMKVEFIGDSITCGYGVEGKNELEPFTTATENAAKSFAGLAAEWMGLDAMLTSYSGYGIVSGYTDDPQRRETDQLVAPYYDRIGRNGFVLPSGHTLQERLWDFSQWQPEKILINLGTNDLSWVQGNEMRKDMYRKLYKEFLQLVRSKNPGAMILCMLGIMGTELNDYMVKAVNEYRAESGDTRIHAMTLQEQDGQRDGYGSNFHPNEITQQRLAQKVQAFLQNT